MVTQIKKILKAQDVGRYFLYLAQQEKELVKITNKKLQKLVYYAQAWSLVLTNKKLFNDPIEAWVHGPAIRSLYMQYKKFDFEPIQEKIKLDKHKILGITKNLLDMVWHTYGKLDAGYLETLTHSEEPWREAREGLQHHESSENEITPTMMKNYYSKKLKKIEEADKRAEKSYNKLDKAEDKRDEDFSKWDEARKRLDKAEDIRDECFNKLKEAEKRMEESESKAEEAEDKWDEDVNKRPWISEII